MKNFKKLLAALLTEQCGQDLVEYALVAALVALVSIAGISRVTNGVITVFASVGAKLSSAV